MNDPQQERVNALAREGRSAGLPWEEVLKLLRSEDATPMQCIKTLRAVGKMSISAAKDLLNGSRAWADQRDRFEKIQESLGTAFDETLE